MECNILNMVNLNDVCRICMKTADTYLSISLFKIIKMLQECTTIQIDENDELPKQICDLCYTQLQTAFDFKHLCEDSDTQFRYSLKNHYESELTIDPTDLSHVLKKEEPSNELDGNVEESTNIQFYEVNIEDDEKTVTTYFSSHFMNGDTEVSHEESPSSNDQDVNVGKEVYICELCLSKFDKVWYLGYHMRRSHGAIGVRCRECPFVCYHPLHLELHEKTHGKTPAHECFKCNRVFKNGAELTTHQLSHGRYFMCTKCKLTLTTRKAIQAHIKEQHPDKPMLLCPVCDNAFLEKALKVHLAKEHPTFRFEVSDRALNTDKLSYKCRICNKLFMHKSSLHRHVKNHLE